MTYKQIEASREARLWIGQIIVPAAVAIGTVLSIPGVRESIVEKFKEKRDKIKTKIKIGK